MKILTVLRDLCLMKCLSYCVCQPCFSFCEFQNYSVCIHNVEQVFICKRTYKIYNEFSTTYNTRVGYNTYSYFQELKRKSVYLCVISLLCVVPLELQCILLYNSIYIVFSNLYAAYNVQVYVTLNTIHIVPVFELSIFICVYIK